MTKFQPVLDAFDAHCDADPTHSAQLAAYIGDELVIHRSVGELGPDSLLPVYSSSKGAAAIVIGLLIERGQLDLDAKVAGYWPEFAAKGKGAVTVRQLLSHQAGLGGVDGGFTADEVNEHDALAQRLAAQRPLWAPGRAFMYHALTLGTLADELCRRIDGRAIGQVLRDDVAQPRGIDVWMGTPASEDDRVVEAMAPTSDEIVDFLSTTPDFLNSADRITAVVLPAGGPLDLVASVNQEPMRRAGPPAAGMLASAAGLARLYAAIGHELDGQERLLSDDTISQMSQIQYDGLELGSGFAVRFGVMFQLPCHPRWPFGSFRAFGHDGAGGSLAFFDPPGDISFAYTVQRLPLPGGMDARAVELAATLRACLGI